MIEITGYDMYNGKRSTPKRFKRRFVKDMTALEAEREKILRRTQRKNKEIIEVFMTYRSFDDCCE
mgnify:CR=1 FL=1